MRSKTKKNVETRPYKVLWYILKTTGFTKFIASFLGYIFVAAILLYLFEPSILSIGDGIWYSFITSTTVGYGDIVVSTVVGRIVSVLLALYGLLFFGCLSGITVSYFLEMNKRLAEATEREEHR